MSLLIGRSQRSQVSWDNLWMSKVKVPGSWRLSGGSWWLSVTVNEWVTRSPIELFWTAKNGHNLSKNDKCIFAVIFRFVTEKLLVAHSFLLVIETNHLFFVNIYYVIINFFEFEFLSFRYFIGKSSRRQHSSSWITWFLDNSRSIAAPKGLDLKLVWAYLEVLSFI